ncbi:efflux RND transporter periplasmic adaptor subunit [Ammoniphilus sp. YIM 78166]|uniref:efflux RND transporter periplasmic adaptor subunit n=1 Tax=Ammoniphilus sp. YIM 78166 TaxID=1644106 RepID=UPI00106FDD70|nr:efflux RND transporter periplasmic adaptor subunit [Ammoniphilus sp. YIM 78166]
MKRNHLVWLSVSFLLVSGCSMGASSQGGPGGAPGQGAMAARAQQAVAVEVEEAKKGDLTVTKKIVGSVLSDKQSDVHATMAGKLLSLQVKKGDRVTQGQVLGRVDTSDTAEAIVQAQFNIESAKQQLQSAQISKKQTEQNQSRIDQLKRQWETARTSLEEMQFLFDQGAAPQSELTQANKQEEEAQIAYENELRSYDIEWERAELAIQQNELSVRKAEATLQELRKNAQKATTDAVIYAPIAGEVMAVNYNVGDQLSTQQPLLTISNNQNLKITTQITAEQRSLLPLGQEVRVVTANPDTSATAQVQYISGTTNANGLYDVELVFSTPGVSISSGEAVQLTFTETLASDVLLVPTHAILQKADTSFVYVVEEGKAVQKKVEVLNAQSDVTAVGGELQMGAQVIVNGHKLVTEGMNVLLPGQVPTIQQGGEGRPGQGQRPERQGGQGQPQRAPSGGGQ